MGSAVHHDGVQVDQCKGEREGRESNVVGEEAAQGRLAVEEGSELGAGDEGEGQQGQQAPAEGDAVGDEGLQRQRAWMCQSTTVPTGFPC